MPRCWRSASVAKRLSTLCTTSRTKLSYGPARALAHSVSLPNVPLLPFGSTKIIGRISCRAVITSASTASAPAWMKPSARPGGACSRYMAGNRRPAAAASE